jgi:hypothetical protein
MEHSRREVPRIWHSNCNLQAVSANVRDSDGGRTFAEAAGSRPVKFEETPEATKRADWTLNPELNGGELRIRPDPHHLSATVSISQVREKWNRCSASLDNAHSMCFSCPIDLVSASEPPCVACGGYQTAEVSSACCAWRLEREPMPTLSQSTGGALGAVIAAKGPASQRRQAGKRLMWKRVRVNRIREEIGAQFALSRAELETLSSTRRTRK